MPEAHQAALALLHPLDEGRHALGRADLLELGQDGLVRGAVQGPVEGGGRPRQGRVGIALGRAYDAHRRRAAVLLMVGVEHEEQVEGPLEDGVGLVLHLGHLEHHVEEVADVGEAVVRAVGRPALVVAVGGGGDGRDLGHDARHLEPPVLRVGHVARIRIEGRERGDRADEEAHRVRVVAEGLDEVLDVRVDHRVVADVLFPGGELGRRGQAPVDDEVGGLEVIGLLGEGLDRVAPVAQDPLLSVDEGDGALGRGRVREARVVGQESSVAFPAADPAQVGGLDRALRQGQLVREPGAVVDYGETVLGHGLTPLIASIARLPRAAGPGRPRPRR